MDTRESVDGAAGKGGGFSMKSQSKSTISTGEEFAGRDGGRPEQSEIEAALCREIIKFQQEHMGRRPDKVHTHILGNLLLVRLHGVLTEAEREMAKRSPAENGLVL